MFTILSRMFRHRTMGALANGSCECYEARHFTSYRYYAQTGVQEVIDVLARWSNRRWKGTEIGNMVFVGL